MNLHNNRYYQYCLCLTLLGVFFTILTKYNGILILQVTPWSLQVEVNGSAISSRCLVDPQIPANNVPEQKLAEYSQISQVHN